VVVGSIVIALFMPMVDIISIMGDPTSDRNTQRAAASGD
jgi:hypothetical protein